MLLLNIGCCAVSDKDVVPVLNVVCILEVVVVDDWSGVSRDAKLSNVSNLNYILKIMLKLSYVFGLSLSNESLTIVHCDEAFLKHSTSCNLQAKSKIVPLSKLKR